MLNLNTKKILGSLITSLKSGVLDTHEIAVLVSCKTLESVDIPVSVKVGLLEIVADILTISCPNSNFYNSIYDYRDYYIQKINIAEIEDERFKMLQEKIRNKSCAITLLDVRLLLEVFMEEASTCDNSNWEAFFRIWEFPLSIVETTVYGNISCECLKCGSSTKKEKTLADTYLWHIFDVTTRDVE